MSTNHDGPIIALDVGRSAVKAKAFYHGELTPDVLFPSIVVRGHALSFTDTNPSSAIDTVAVDGVEYFTGETARIQGNAESSVGLSHDWIESSKYKALVLSAMKRLREQHGVVDIQDALVVVGTPSSLFGAQRQKLEMITRQIVGAEVKALPQPMGAYLSHVYDDGGVPIRDRIRDTDGRRKTWAVVEIGYYTTDFLLMQEGQYVESKAHSCKGLQVACENLIRILSKRNLSITPLESQEAIRTKSIISFGKKDVTAEVNEAMVFLTDEILNTAEGLYARSVQTFDGVLIAGGAAPVGAPPLQQKWANAVLVQNPRTAVVNGYIKYGRFQDNLKRATERKAAVATLA